MTKQTHQIATLRANAASREAGRKYTVSWSGYIALGTGDDPATQRDADQYDTPPDGYFDLAHEKLGITPLNGGLPYIYATEGEAAQVADFIGSDEGADCYGVAVRSATVEPVNSGEIEDARELK